MQQLRIAAACCSWACALFSFALQQDRSIVQTAVFSVTYLKGLGSSAWVSAVAQDQKGLHNRESVSNCCSFSRAYKAHHKRAGENVVADQARLLEIPCAQTRSG